MKHGPFSLLVVAISMLSCSPEKPKHEEFLRLFVASVIDDTDFHRQYIEPGDKTDFSEYRVFMSNDYEIFHQDMFDLHWGVLYGRGIYEYGICFASDTPGFVDIAELGGTPKSVSLHVRTLQRCDGSLKVPLASTPKPVGEPAGP